VYHRGGREVTDSVKLTHAQCAQLHGTQKTLQRVKKKKKKKKQNQKGHQIKNPKTKTEGKGVKPGPFAGDAERKVKSEKTERCGGRGGVELEIGKALKC